MKSHEYLDRARLDALYAKFREIATEELGVDTDGDSQIDIQIVDRTRYERSHYLHILYDDKVSTPSEYEKMLGSLMANLSIATEALSRWQRCRSFTPYPTVVTATDEHLADENRKLTKQNIAIKAEIREIRQDVGAKIRRDQAVKDAREKRERMTDALHHVWSCTKQACKECEGFKKEHRLVDKA